MKHFVAPYKWREFQCPRFQDVLDSWVGTPYVLGSAAKKQGVDCVRFVCSVLDEMYGTRRIPENRLPSDLSLHDKIGALSAMKQIISAYKPNQHVEDFIWEPGDIVVVGAPNAGPGHAMIVSCRKNVLYHATNQGIVTTGITFPVGTSLDVFRLLDKEKWNV